LSGQELLHHTLFRNFRCAEVNGLFEYIKNESKSDHPLIYTGFDNQMSSNYFIKFINPIIKRYDVGLSDSLQHKLNGYVRWFRAGYHEKPDEFEKEAKTFVETSQRIRNVFVDNQREIVKLDGLTQIQLAIIDKTVENFIQTVQLKYEDQASGSAHRDSLMFENLQWILKELYHDKKVIIWAHNAHIEQNPMFENSFKWLGHYLNEYYNEDYYTLGLFAKAGEYYRQWGDTTIAFNHVDTTMMEEILSREIEHVGFLDLSNSNQSSDLKKVKAPRYSN